MCFVLEACVVGWYTTSEKGSPNRTEPRLQQCKQCRINTRLALLKVRTKADGSTRCGRQSDDRETRKWMVESWEEWKPRMEKDGVVDNRQPVGEASRGP